MPGGTGGYFMQRSYRRSIRRSEFSKLKLSGPQTLSFILCVMLIAALFVAFLEAVLREPAILN